MLKMSKEAIKNGDMTNKGLVKMVDNPWKHEDGSDADVLVMTHKGPFRMSELEKIEKAERPDMPMKDLVDFPTVMSVDIRPGRVNSAERIPKKDKLIHLVVDTYFGKKNIVTNLGSHYEPSDFLGKTFMFIVNMPPVKMGGVLSEAMITAVTAYKFNADDNIYEEVPQLHEVNLPLNVTIL
jgi:methionine--tRNA ligase beta chain